MTRQRKTLEQQILQLEAKKKSLQARLKKQGRAKETRRKILIGAFILERMDSKRDPEFAHRLTEWLKRDLPGFLTREADHKLFDDILETK
ncbi:MAG: mobilization protein [Nereida ignava]